MPNTIKHPANKARDASLKAIRSRLGNAIAKASNLMEALPYLQAFQGKTFVIKTGGSTLNDKKMHQFIQDLIFLNTAGIRLVLVHGGGPEISAAMKSKGIKPKFVSGLRVTHRETVKLISQVLFKINVNLVAYLHSMGNVTAKTLHGGKPRANILKVVRQKVNGHDIGWVGKIRKVQTQKIQRLLAKGVIPVITPMATDSRGRTYNVNADQASAAIAASLKAEKFVLVTDTTGIFKNNRLLHTLSRSEAKKLIKEGTIKGGMIPKTQACIEALAKGVHKTHMIDIRIPHGLLLEIFTFEGIGTEIIHDEL